MSKLPTGEPPCSSEVPKPGPNENIGNLLKVTEFFTPSAETIANAWVKDYVTAYKESIRDVPAFWDKAARDLDWFYPLKQVLLWDYSWAKWCVAETCDITYTYLDLHH